MSNKRGSASAEYSFYIGATAPSDGDVEVGVLWVDTTDTARPVLKQCTSEDPVTFSNVILQLLETTTPSAIADNARIYTKSDNNLYFQDGAGVEHVVEIGAANIRELWIDPREATDADVGNFAVVTINASQSVHFNFEVPGDFETLVKAEVVMIPDATETIQWDVLASVAQGGIIHTDDDRISSNQTQSVTVNIVTDIDISEVLGTLIPNDHVAIDFQADTANLRIVGFVFEYN